MEMMVGNEKKRNIWLDGMIGTAIGDALGCPVQFLSRTEIRKRGLVTGMEGYGTYNQPAGTWTDDTSMAIAAMDSMIATGKIDPDDIMENFADWERCGAYTPFGKAFDEGNTCLSAIYAYLKDHDCKTCGKTGEYANGNGALMRIMPVVLFFLDRKRRICTSDQEAIEAIHTVGSLTHRTLRSNMACGLFYFMAKEILKEKEQAAFAGREGNASMTAILQAGLDQGFKFYAGDLASMREMTKYSRLFDLDAFSKLPDEKIKSSGYVVDTLEAAIWCLLTTNTFADCLLKAVNLGDDTDTVGAVAGGLAGLYYGYDSIPKDWLLVLQKREGLERLCELAAEIRHSAS